MPGADATTFFFMHIMKTAGTSFVQQIHRNFPAEEVFPLPDGPRRGEQYWKVAEVRALGPEERAGVRVFCGHFPFLVGELVGADVTLTLLRDPVERTISHLRHCERHFERHHGKSLEEIYDDDWHHPLLFRNYQVKQFALTDADAPKAHNEVIDIDAGRLALASETLEQVTVLGLTERYDEFLDEVSARYGWEMARGLWYQGSPGEVTVPAALRARIVEDSAADIAFYEHAVSLYDRRRVGR